MNRTSTVCLALFVFLSCQSIRADNSTSTESTCQVCRDTGNCAKAYQGNPGKYCGAWLDKASQRQACCCPQDAVCKLENYACNCAASSKSSPTSSNTNKSDGSSNRFLPILLGVIGLALICGIGFFVYKKFAQRSSDGNAFTGMPAQAPAPGHGMQYAPPGQPPMYAPAYNQSYAPAYGNNAYGPGYDNGRSNGGMSKGAAVAAGVLGGMAGGYLLNEALDGGDHGYNNQEQMMGGGDNNYGGYGGGASDGTFAGDF